MNTIWIKPNPECTVADGAGGRVPVLLRDPHRRGFPVIPHGRWTAVEPRQHWYRRAVKGELLISAVDPATVPPPPKTQKKPAAAGREG